ncbi:DNA polymerase IV [Candidatus Bathyarchaeota archaeon]|nr:DNA polymerase IV [Candidatus Bathyarchaeota archaeon]
MLTKTRNDCNQTSHRVILHIDLDAFFASIEEVNHPELKGRPIIVGADPKQGKGRGVVSTCNYEARKFGLHSAMPISHAWKLCPEAAYLPVNMPLYEEVSKRIINILKPIADRLEQVSIDEAFLDISHKIADLKEAQTLAKEIKSIIMDRESLTCSIGIGPNKLVAKIASDHRKPNGLTIVSKNDVRKFLAPLNVEKLGGIGSKTKERLNSIGIKTIDNLASYDINKLKDIFGAWGEEFHRMAHGIDESEIIEEWIPKSFSREYTFDQDTSNFNKIKFIVNKLCEEVTLETKENGFSFRTITVKIRYENFETHTHSKTLSFPTSSTETMKNTSMILLRPFLRSDRRIRLLGIRASNLSEKAHQKTLEGTNHSYSLRTVDL